MAAHRLRSPGIARFRICPSLRWHLLYTTRSPPAWMAIAVNEGDERPGHPLRRCLCGVPQPGRCASRSSRSAGQRHSLGDGVLDLVELEVCWSVPPHHPLGTSPLRVSSRAWKAGPGSACLALLAGYRYANRHVSTFVTAALPRTERASSPCSIRDSFLLKFCVALMLVSRSRSGWPRRTWHRQQYVRPPRVHLADDRDSIAAGVPYALRNARVSKPAKFSLKATRGPVLPEHRSTARSVVRLRHLEINKPRLTDRSVALTPGQGFIR
ncbi:hypothetical protein ShzoTeo12_53510 (plasmid) [Shinella zoogloeoides]|nr:hypothetical protein ShzoTeo12_53510 [Shinella zoogloeoides]